MGQGKLVMVLVQFTLCKIIILILTFILKSAFLYLPLSKFLHVRFLVQTVTGVNVLF